MGRGRRAHPGRVLTGLSMAFVNVPRPPPEHVLLVREGEALPGDVTDAEVDRLDGLGAFGEHPREAHARLLADLTAKALAAAIPEPERSDEENDADKDLSQGEEPKDEEPSIEHADEA